MSRPTLTDHDDAGRTRPGLASPLTDPCTAPLSVSIDWLRQARQHAAACGERELASDYAHLMCSHLLMRGHSLTRDYDEVRGCLELARAAGPAAAATRIAIAERTVACLMGKTHHLADFSDPGFDGRQFECEIAASGLPALIQCYWARKAMLHFLAGDPNTALAAAQAAFDAPCDRAAQVEHIECHFFTALAMCARLRNVTTLKTESLRAGLAEHADRIRQWARATRSGMATCRHLLLSAEIASLDGDGLDAERLYEDSVRTARQDGSLLIEGLARELASRFHGARGLGRIADAYFDDAIECYGRWGAEAKVRQLTRSHPRGRVRLPGAGTVQARTLAAAPGPFASGQESAQPRASDGITRQLTMTLMRKLAEHAGAERAVLMLAGGDTLQLAAEVTIEGDATRVSLPGDGRSQTGMPDSVIRYAWRTGESVVVEDAQTDSRFQRDPHVSQYGVRSALCLPIVAHAKLQAVLYLENNLMARVFTQVRLDVLRLLATLAAISVENARLYADLQMREYKLRRLFEVDVIGIIFWDLDGKLLDANDAFLRMVGYSREDLESGAMGWFQMTPPEWRDQVVREIEQIKTTGALRPVEKEYFRKDGTRLPVLMGATAFDETIQQGVAIIVDLSRQKEAEARALAVERSNRMLHAELAHTNRLLTMGHLSAWIAHDVKQPLAGLVTSGNAALRWLAADPPNIGAAMRALERVVRDSRRAADILDRTSALMRKAPPDAEAVDINAVIGETLSLVVAEAAGKGIEIVLALHPDPIFAIADRTQLQQVILNLLINALEAMDADTVAAPRQLRIFSGLDPLGGVMVEVQDTGPGLPTADSEDCFQAFYTTKPRGLGVGLAICRSIIEAFGGRISASPNVPRGANFRFVIPQRGARRPHTAPGEAA